MFAQQQEACARLIERRRSLLVTEMGMGSRQVAAVAAARIAQRDRLPVQVVDSLAMHSQWRRDFAREEFDARYIVTPQWMAKHYMLPIVPTEALTVVHLDTIAMFGGRSYTRIRDYLGWYRETWDRDPEKAPRMICIIHHSELLKRLPLVSHLFPVDSTSVVSLGSQVQDVDLRKLRDAYVKASVVKPWGTETPGRGILSRRWAESEKGKQP